jgi:hypothetical protein
MSATTIMIVALGAGILGRWANNKDAIPSGRGLVEIVFMLLVISALDSGQTADIAKGFAGLFLAAVLLGKNSPLNGIAKIANQKKG